MSTVTRPELSKKNKYYISRERYYELKHFCFQYPEWKKCLAECSNSLKSQSIHVIEKHTPNLSSIESVVVYRDRWLSRVEMIENIAKLTDEALWPYILKAVTQNYSCDYLILKEGMPCCRDTFYDRYRRFFWLLDQARK